MSMSRDGLLPKAFSRIHPKFRTPSFSTIVTGVLVAVPSLFMQSSLVVDLTSIGTLFAFIIVSGGVLLLPRRNGPGKGFRLPYINGRYLVPVLYLLFVFIMRERISRDFHVMSIENLQEVLFMVYVLFACGLSVVLPRW